MKNLIAGLLLLILTSCASKPVYKHSLDAHMHIHPSDEVDDMEFHGARALLAANSIGIERAIVISSAYSKMAYKEFARTQNAFVASEVRKNKQHLAGACAVNPMMDWAKNELHQCRKDGLEILKIHTLASGMDLRRSEDLKHFKEVLKQAQDLNFTLLIHGHLPKPHEAEQMLRALEGFPKLRIIIGHSMGREFELLRSFKHPHFLVETSIAPFWMKSDEEKKKLVKLIKDVGIEKFIFGSDWPVMHPAENLKAISELPLTEEERVKIVYTNAESLDDLFK